ncbi:hypothetical protein M9H77_35810 [Catharanthus roseus]|uniref:Uncharacterized protein n=1 Tax=Catharanthus roseus TaxID=4058 RepID=A0ACB9ZQB9_CATRO|nr:hypothetical protein M9H77_35810 [Catharanthus roseus]
MYSEKGCIPYGIEGMQITYYAGGFTFYRRYCCANLLPVLSIAHFDDFFQGSITRTRAKKIKECVDGVNNDLMLFADKVLKEGFKPKIEGLEEGQKASKMFMLHVISKEH